MTIKDKIANKNLDLSASFSGYLMRNPEVACAIKSKSTIFFEVKGDKEFNKANMRLATMAKKAGEICYKAVRNNNSWKIEVLAGSR